MIRLNSVTKSYQAGDSNTHLALNNVNLFADSGTVTIVKGPQGAGKTVLLHLIAGIERPTQGTIQVGEYDLTAAAQGVLNQYRQKAVGFVAKQSTLLAGLTPIENVELPAVFAGMSESQRMPLVLTTLQFMGLSNNLYRHIKLSGLDQRLIAFARANLFDPPVFIADDPTHLMNITGAEVIASVLDKLILRGKTIVVASNDAMLLRQAHQVIHLSHGHTILP